MRSLVEDTNILVKDWSLVTGKGGYKTGGGGIFPLRKGGRAEKGLSHAKGGHKNFQGSFYTLA